MELMIRAYDTTDFDGARELWAELVQHHRDIYNDPLIGGSDPGTQFEQYLNKSNLVGPWIAVDDSAVIGLMGLLVDGSSAEIEPLIVRADCRRSGVGARLITHAKQEAARRGARSLIIRPVARNAEAMKCFYQAGFTVLGQLEMFMDLVPERRRKWESGITIHGREYRY